MPTTKPQCLLLDTMVVLKLHESNLWSQLTSSCDIFLPSSVIRNEALFYNGENGEVVIIDLLHDAKNGAITEIAATANDLAVLATVFDVNTFKGLGDGEREAIALINQNVLPKALFCTSDGAAIQAIVMMGRSDSATSFETLLKVNRINLPKNLEFWFKEDYFKKRIREGQVNLASGIGITEAYRQQMLGLKPKRRKK